MSLLFSPLFGWFNENEGVLVCKMVCPRKALSSKAKQIPSILASWSSETDDFLLLSFSSSSEIDLISLMLSEKNTFLHYEPLELKYEFLELDRMLLLSFIIAYAEGKDRSSKLAELPSFEVVFSPSGLLNILPHGCSCSISSIAIEIVGCLLLLLFCWLAASSIESESSL